ncbi:helix-turn-helix domain-containing protein [Nocardia jejuensis]|uniref:helix-turn-helix domain-containing protein n=1 Tax=Nocardia jejuensis TaxID=328049 RepID=UPI000AB7D96B|nr:helix-turn-helix domain-containing protein [Nocardia jejuensis]
MNTPSTAPTIEEVEATGGAGAISGWEIARPGAGRGLPGIDMAGFMIRAGAATEIRAVPHPAVTVIVEFGGHAFSVDDGRGGGMSESLALGLASSSFHARADGIGCVQIRLSPIATRAVLGVPAGELGGGLVALEDLWGGEAAALRERLHHARTWSARFAVMDDVLRGRMRVESAVDPEVAWVWRQILRGRGRARIAELAAETGWSRQRLWSRFDAQIGLTPKRAAMLIRFDHAVHRLARGQSPARVAADSGYADQSHLHRDIRAFTGTSPAASAREPWLAADDTAWPAGTSARL